jgi:hypothetical protein
MTTRVHPYQGAENRAFWNRSVSDRHFAELADLWDGMPLTKVDRIATAGSCFAQHIGNNLRRHGANFLDLEPAPAFLPPESTRHWGYGIFTCRYGNIYTTRQLVQLFDEAFGERRPLELVWERDRRCFDAMRPAIDPVGQANAQTVLALRDIHLAAVRQMFETLDLFVMTLGLTEAWMSRKDGTVYPTAPGTIAGAYDPDFYQFVNFDYAAVLQDMEDFWNRLKTVNPAARLLLTVSPVPLQATASGQHVLVATTQSKSILRAVAGNFCEGRDEAWYFPSYEIITAPTGRGMYYDPDWRNVNQYGVDYVMTHFFAKLQGDDFGTVADANSPDDEVVCDEEAMFRSIDR